MHRSYASVGNNDLSSILRCEECFDKGSGIFGMGIKSPARRVWLCLSWAADNSTVMEQINFEVGDSFPTIDAVKERIELYSKQIHVPFSIDDCRTIKSAIATNRMSASISEEKANLLHYYEVKFACIHGGRKHRNRGTGKRKSLVLQPVQNRFQIKWTRSRYKHWGVNAI